MAVDVRAYLERIGLEGSDTSLDLEFLKKVQYAHILTVPYENLDILNDIPLSLDKQELFDKIVNRRRGGYCFEVNGLLSFMLMEIGF